MSEYNVYPSMDEEFNFPPSIRAAIAAYPELVNFFAPKANPTFTGTVSGITKAHVGLSNVNNTTDAAKPVSTATQTALNLKANLASPTFTGTVGGITKAMVGLSNVDNTSDANKPLSTAQKTYVDRSALGLVAETPFVETRLDANAETYINRIAVPVVSGRSYHILVNVKTSAPVSNLAYALKIKWHTANDSSITGTIIEEGTFFTAIGTWLGKDDFLQTSFKATTTGTIYIKITGARATGSASDLIAFYKRMISVYDAGIV